MSGQTGPDFLRKPFGIGGLAPTVGVDRAHEAHGVAVGILDDGVAGTPEGVPGLLTDPMAGGGEPSEHLVHRGAGLELEADDHARTARAGVPPAGEGDAVEIEVDTGMGGAVVGFPFRGVPPGSIPSRR